MTAKARKKRLEDAKEWLKTRKPDDKSDLLKEYRKRFGVDKVCAKRELCRLQVLPKEKQQEYTADLERREQHLQRKRERKRREREEREYLKQHPFEQDEYFYYIAGYTSGGAPYGITWEQQAEFERKEMEAETDPEILRLQREAGISDDPEDDWNDPEEYYLDWNVPEAYDKDWDKLEPLDPEPVDLNDFDFNWDEPEDPGLPEVDSIPPDLPDRGSEFELGFSPDDLPF